MAKIVMSKKIEEETLEAGDFLLRKSTGEVYILAMISARTYSLISLNDGNRWKDPASIEDCFGSEPKASFVKITSPFTVEP